MALAPLLAPLDRVECHHALFPFHCNKPSEKKNVYASVQQRIADLAALEGQAGINVREAAEGAAKDAAKATHVRVFKLLHISVALVNSLSGHHKEQATPPAGAAQREHRWMGRGVRDLHRRPQQQRRRALLGY
jgi:hypothetical protein